MSHAEYQQSTQLQQQHQHAHVASSTPFAVPMHHNHGHTIDSSLSSSSASSIRSKSKRPREPSNENDQEQQYQQQHQHPHAWHDTNTLMHDDGGAMQIQRSASIELEHKYDDESTSDLQTGRPAMKKPCHHHHPMAINVEANGVNSVSSSPFLSHLSFGPSASGSLPSSLSVSPALPPVAHDHRHRPATYHTPFAHTNTHTPSTTSGPFAAQMGFVGVGDSILPSASALASHTNPHLTSHSLLSMSIDTQPTSIQTFPFGAGSSATTHSHSNSSAAYSTLAPNTTSTTTTATNRFRIESPSQRPINSIVAPMPHAHDGTRLILSIPPHLSSDGSDSHVVFGGGLSPSLPATGYHASGGHSILSSPPSSPTGIACPTHLHQPSTPSRTGASPSRSSVYSMPHLQRGRSNGGSTVDLTFPSSIESSHPTSPVASRSYMAYPSSPSFDRSSEPRAFSLSCQSSSLPSDRGFVSRMHTPTPTATYPINLPNQPGVEIGLGILYMNPACHTQTAHTDETCGMEE